MLDLTIAPSGRPVELLLVEDNDGDVLLAREAFRCAKITNNLSVASDGEQAMGMLRRQGPHAGQPRPDLILLDLNLPRMDGHQVLHEIKADPELRDIPVIVMSRSRTEIDFLKRSALGADGYSIKPVDLDRLGEILSAGVAVVVSAAGAEGG